MTEVASASATLTLKDVTFGDNRIVIVFDEGNIVINKDLTIKNVLLVDNLKHNDYYESNM